MKNKAFYMYIILVIENEHIEMFRILTVIGKSKSFVSWLQQKIS